MIEKHFLSPWVFTWPVQFLAADRRGLHITVALCLSAFLTVLGLAAAFQFCRTELTLAYRNLSGHLNKPEGNLLLASAQTSGKSSKSKFCHLLCSARWEALWRLCQLPPPQQQIQWVGTVRPAGPSWKTGEATWLLSLHSRPRWFPRRRSGALSSAKYESRFHLNHLSFPLNSPENLDRTWNQKTISTTAKLVLQHT